MDAEGSRFVPEVIKGLWKENPVFVAVLGLCPTMAVTNSLNNALVMGVATGGVLVGSGLLVSLARRFIPQHIRIAVYIVIIATFVTVVDYALAALLPAAHNAVLRSRDRLELGRDLDRELLGLRRTTAPSAIAV